MVTKHFYYISFQVFHFYLFIAKITSRIRPIFLHHGEIHTLSNLMQNEPLSASQIFLSSSYLFPRHNDIRSTSKFFLINAVSKQQLVNFSEKHLAIKFLKWFRISFLYITVSKVQNKLLTHHGIQGSLTVSGVHLQYALTPC